MPKDHVQTKSKKNAISAYLDNLRRFDRLKHEEVVELFQTFERGGKAADVARTKLVECNLRLVVSIAKQYYNHKMPMEDLIQEGNIGLMKSIERFDWKRGFRFSTYATWWIKQAIGQHVLKRKRIIRLPAHAVTVQRKMIQAAEGFREEFGVEPTVEELAELIDASPTVIKATMHSGRGTISLAHPVSRSGEGDTIGDKIEDDNVGANPFANVSEKELLDITRRVMEMLSPKEAAILRLRFGLVEEADNSEEYPITEDEMQTVMNGRGLH